MIFSEKSAPSHPPTAPCSTCVPCCGNSFVCVFIVGCGLFCSIYNEVLPLLGQSCSGVITPHLPSRLKFNLEPGEGDGTQLAFPLLCDLLLTLLSPKPESSEPFMTESRRKKKDLTLQVNLAFALGVLLPLVMFEAL